MGFDSLQRERDVSRGSVSDSPADGCGLDSEASDSVKRVVRDLVEMLELEERVDLVENLIVEIGPERFEEVVGQWFDDSIWHGP